MTSTAQRGTVDGRPGPQTAGTTRVVHHGGPRHGTVAQIATAALSTYLVYDGPRWFGVYEPAAPPRSISTPAGPAQLWVAVDR